MAEVPVINGAVSPGYERVIDAFTQNFSGAEEVGAACSAYVDGRQVVDLWGGLADSRTGRAWTEDTIVMVYSVGKGMAAICAHLLVQRGELDLDRPVADYWPEFGVNGKETITTRMILSHRAGLPAIERTLRFKEVLAPEQVIGALAAQAPYWEPGLRHGYHVLTFGWLVSEIVRRVTGQSIGAFFAEQVAAPLGLSTWIGLPESEHDRVSPLIPFTRAEYATVQLGRDRLDKASRVTSAARRAAFADPDSLMTRASTLNGALGTFAAQNSRAFLASEIPSLNVVSDARSLARAYAACVSSVAGLRILNAQHVVAAIEPASQGMDAVLLAPTRFGLGFALPTESSPMLSASSFGHAGSGGSLAFGDVAHRVGFGYVMNKLGAGFAPFDMRAARLVAALRDCLA